MSSTTLKRATVSSPASLKTPAKRLHESDLDTRQKFASMMIRKWKCLLLAAAMGTGKTAATLDAIKRLLKDGRITRVLIVAPKRVATDTWPDEIERWSCFDSLGYAVAVGSPQKRIDALKSDAEIVTINRENFLWLYTRYFGKRWPFDMIVWDESSSLRDWSKVRENKKAPKGKRRKLTRFGALAKVQDQVDYMVELTGTPASNGLKDLGGQIYILDQGARLGREKQDFLNRWFDADYMGWKHTPKPDAEKEIMDRLKDIMISIEIPEKERIVPKFRDVWVNLSREHMKEYARFKRTLVSEKFDVEAASSGVLTGKLLQFANGAMYQQPELVEKKRRDGEYDARWERHVVHVHDEKLEALESVLEEAGGRSILVAYSFKFDRDAILKRFGKRVKCIGEYANGIRDWNAGKVEIALVHPASIGHGTNLQYGGYLACWYGLTWSAELYRQLNMRLPRRGQKNDVLIYRILARGTLDEKIIGVLEDRTATEDRILDAVRYEIRDMEKKLAA